jgi:hypothetical protein
VLLSCHGEDGNFVIPYQNSLTAVELAQIVHLPNHIVVSLGCSTGAEALAGAFLDGGCEAYVAPTGDVEANAAMLFAIHLYYFLEKKWPLGQAVEESRKHDAQCSLFKMWLPK